MTYLNKFIQASDIFEQVDRQMRETSSSNINKTEKFSSQIQKNCYILQTL